VNFHSLPPRRIRATPRQQQVLDALCRGLGNKEIARELGLSDKTVKHYFGGLMRAYGVTSRLQLLLAYAKEGLS
jgi:two-component system nitrate/nitrite response regulator NarL